MRLKLGCSELASYKNSKQTNTVLLQINNWEIFEGATVVEEHF